MNVSNLIGLNKLSSLPSHHTGIIISPLLFFELHVLARTVDDDLALVHSLQCGSRKFKNHQVPALLDPHRDECQVPAPHVLVLVRFLLTVYKNSALA
jgi:hypothetical protein